MSQSKSKKDKKEEPVVYVPDGAEINFTSSDMNPPRTEYERRKGAFKRAHVKNLTKGKYGNNDTDN